MESAKERLNRLRERAGRRLQWEAIDPHWLKTLIGLARDEDLAGGGLAASPAFTGDATTASLDNTGTGRAALLARKEMTLCGTRLIPLIAEAFGGGFSFVSTINDGRRLAQGSAIGELHGDVRSILRAERTLLNFLQKLSGIATLTARYVAALDDSPTRLLDTRKTTPGYRVLEKYAVACGGGWNHRLGLYDRVMLKDNHLAAAGATDGQPLADAVARARSQYTELLIEVEVDRPTQIAHALDAGADILLLDNFDNTMLTDAVSVVGDRALTEASGGITLERLPSLAALGLDFISTGATVHQSTWVDIGLDWL